MRYIVILASIFFIQCHQVYHPHQDQPKEYIKLGSYGGFAGTSDVYYYYPGASIYNSTMIMGDTSTEVIETVGALSCDQFKAIKEELKTLKINDFPSTKPGNMTYFVVLVKGKSETKAVWNNMDAVSAEWAAFYRKYTTVATDQ